MNLKKILLLSVMLGGLSLSVSAVGFDFNLGVGGGLQSSFENSDSFKKYVQEKLSDLKINGKISDINWNIGGFGGLGVKFGEGNFSSAVGLEWTGQFQAFHTGAKASFGDNTGKIGRTKNAFGQFFDVYYGLNMGFIPHLPIGVYFKLGMTYRKLLEAVDKIDINGRNAKNVTKYDGKGGHESISTLGLHLGARVNIHMLYLGLDYSYLPNYTVKSQDSSGNWKVEKQATGGNSYWKANELSFSVGLMINKAIINSFKSNRPVAVAPAYGTATYR